MVKNLTKHCNSPCSPKFFHHQCFLLYIINFKVLLKLFCLVTHKLLYCSNILVIFLKFYHSVILNALYYILYMAKHSKWKTFPVKEENSLFMRKCCLYPYIAMDSQESIHCKGNDLKNCRSFSLLRITAM